MWVFDLVGSVGELGDCIVVFVWSMLWVWIYLKKLREREGLC